VAENNHLWILVHGTFASDAPWTHPDSALSQRLARDRSISLRQFNWSGRNSGVARYKAAGALADLVRSLQDDYDAISLVAHSHGGNIVRLALESDGVRPVESCIFLGTPFIVAWRRDVGSLLRISAIALLTAVLFMGWNAIGFKLQFPYVFPMAFAALLLLLVFSIAYSFRDYADRVFPKSAVTTRKRDYVFFCELDEANRLLKSLEFIPNLGSALLRFFSSLALVCGMHWKTVLYAIPIAVGLGLLFREGELFRLPFDLAVMLALSATVSLVLMVLLGAIWVPISAILRFSPVSFGYEGFFSILNLELWVGRSPPPNEAASLSVFRAEFGRRSGLSLHHSAFYDDAGVLDMIGNIAGAQEPIPSEHIRRASIDAPSERPEPNKFGLYTAPALLFGLFLMALLSEIQPLVVLDDQVEAGKDDGPYIQCDHGVCTELNNFDPNFVDGCTIEPDGSCTPPG
jgi:Alpha/beta hydrolase family